VYLLVACCCLCCPGPSTLPLSPWHAVLCCDATEGCEFSRS
jgi:hypothetical protein